VGLARALCIDFLVAKITVHQGSRTHRREIFDDDATAVLNLVRDGERFSE
jgi:hypothetical protein